MSTPSPSPSRPSTYSFTNITTSSIASNTNSSAFPHVCDDPYCPSSSGAVCTPCRLALGLKDRPKPKVPLTSATRALLKATLENNDPKANPLIPESEDEDEDDEDDEEEEMVKVKVNNDAITHEWVKELQMNRSIVVQAGEAFTGGADARDEAIKIIERRAAEERGWVDVGKVVDYDQDVVDDEEDEYGEDQVVDDDVDAASEKMRLDTRPRSAIATDSEHTRSDNTHSQRSIHFSQYSYFDPSAVGTDSRGARSDNTHPVDMEIGPRSPRNAYSSHSSAYQATFDDARSDTTQVRPQAHALQYAYPSVSSEYDADHSAARSDNLEPRFPRYAHSGNSSYTTSAFQGNDEDARSDTTPTHRHHPHSPSHSSSHSFPSSTPLPSDNPGNLSPWLNTVFDHTLQGQREEKHFTGGADEEQDPDVDNCELCGKPLGDPTEQHFLKCKFAHEERERERIALWGGRW